MDEFELITIVRKDGKASKKITITDAVKAIGVDVGDYVKVRITKVE